MEVNRKFTFGLKETKYMVVNAGAEEETLIKEKVEAWKVGRIDINKCLGIIIIEKGDLEEYIKEKAKVAKPPTAQIKAIGSAQQCGTEYHKAR